MVNSSTAKVGVLNSSKETWDSKAEARVLRRCDFNVVPILYTLYMLSYLDRINIGNARIEGLAKDLGMSGDDYNIAVQIFFVPYILLEVPSNIALRHVTPSTWLSMIMFFWVKYHGLVASFQGLLACRSLLGLFESGLAPGALYLFTMYYKRYEMQRRYTLYSTSGIITGAFGGVGGLPVPIRREGPGLNGFVVPSIRSSEDGRSRRLRRVAMLIGRRTQNLDDNERALLLHRLENDDGYAKMDHLDRATLRRILGDWKLWVGALIYLGSCTSNYSISYYLPTVLNEFGYKASDAQVQAIPIYAAALVSALIAAWMSDRLRHRFSFVILGAAINVIGLIVLLAQASLSVKVKYMALYFVRCGLWIGSPIEIVWIASNLGGHYKRTIGSAIQVASGNLSGFIAGNVFIAKQSPRYPTGYGVALVMTVVVAASANASLVGYRSENRRRCRGERDYRLQTNREKLENLGDDHPSFRYAL
ncbi:MAG: hypothetical protein Q9209_000817 [Squamulea sp. 1 TL-2023]